MNELFKFALAQSVIRQTAITNKVLQYSDESSAHKADRFADTLNKVETICNMK